MNDHADPDTAGASSARAAMFALQERMLSGSAARSRYVDLEHGRRIHLLEAGDGPPLVHLHGTNTSSLSHLALLDRLPDVWSIAPDRPGLGLSDPLPTRPADVRDAAVRFVDEVLDAVGVQSAVLAGGSMGGVWAIWFALARPERAIGLVLLGSPPMLQGARIPAPLRLVTTPVLGDLLTRVRPSRANVIRLMTFMGEGKTIIDHPDLLDSLVVGARDPITRATNLAELRSIITPRGARPQMQIRPDELRRLTVPTLLVWGDHDPVASVEVAEGAARLIPRAQLEVLPAGHVPWLGHPDHVAELVSAFTRG